MAAPTITTLAVEIFDLDADVPVSLVTLQGGDKFLVADVSAVGAPNKYITASNLRSYLYFRISAVSGTLTASSVSDSDVFVLRDTTANTDKRFTIAEAKKVFGTA